MRWIATFSLLLLICATVPVLAASGAESPGNPTATEAPAPSVSALAELEVREREHADWVEGPEAAQQRQASRTAYADLSAGAARDLLIEAFPDQLDALNADPARLISGLKIEQALGTYAALISDAKGERAIIESSVPIKSERGGEGRQPVDLSLKQSGGDFVPENPLTEVRLPGSAGGSIRLQGGIEVGLPASNDHSALGLGEKNLFYPETDVATDTLVSPISSGVEVFEQLRSPESPERFRFDLGLPNGAKLRSTEEGGAEALSASGEVIGLVRPPSAVDVQGAVVPVTMGVEGASLLLEVPHRSRDFAYPILVDPEFIEEGLVAFNQWAPSWTDAYNLSNSSSLFAQAQGGSYSYKANTYGHWAYAAPGQTAYIAAATFYSASFTLPENCYGEQPTNQPHGYAGLYNPSTGGWSGLGIWSGGSGYTSAHSTGWVGGNGVRYAIAGIGTTVQASHKCAFTFSVGGVTIQEKDPEAPTIDWVSGTSSSWTKDISVTAHASDPGLGVDEITLSPEGKNPQPAGGCTGTYTNRCPPTRQVSFGVGYFAEGQRGASITAHDPLGPDNGAHVSSSYQWTTRLDRTKPEVELEGQLTEAIEEAEEAEEESAEEVPQLRLPVYNLRIEATDKAATGNPETEAKARRSGVKDIAVFIDEEEMEVPWEAQGCSGPTYSCPMEEIYPVYLDTLEGGPVHKLTAVVEDQVGNVRQREIEFEYIPATGMKDEYVMQYFPLPDGEGNEEEEEENPSRPELAVNVVNGNLVFRQKDVDVEGPSVDLEVERFYNSQLPEEDDTEWGDGWTLAQTPRLEPEETPEEALPEEAEVLGVSGETETAVDLPTEAEEESFDADLQAVVTKEAGGGYEVEDQSGETDTTLAFDKAGKVKGLRTSGYASIDYEFEEGELAEIAVRDPASFDPKPMAVLEEEQQVAVFSTAFGSNGSGNGQFDAPGAVAFDPTGNLWVADTEGGRIEHFSRNGEYLGKLGEGKLSSPYAIDTDAQGHLWIADFGGYRVVEFAEGGAELSSFEVEDIPMSIAINAQGNVVVSGLFYPEPREFSPSGEQLATIESGGRAEAMDVDQEGNLWVADTDYNKVKVFDQEGGLIRSFGSYGTGKGQFKSPGAIHVDPNGQVWVADRENDRVQVFTEAGDYIASFGESGSGEGQLNLGGSFTPTGLVADAKGRVWVADTENDRVERWLPADYESGEEPLPEDDPRVEVETPEGLVASVEGEEAGETTYSHEGEKLIAVDGPQGETEYDYDAEERLTKVTLPNGTWGEVKYDEAGRVKSVTVDPTGEEPEKTTYFYYKEEPRRTTVDPEGAPATVYDIGPDGSVLKWWNTASPPEIQVISGGLYQNRETAEPTEPGDYELEVLANSPHGIASIDIVADGDQLVDETTCEQDYEQEGTECLAVESLWVTNTGNWAPGILNLEVIVTDANEDVETERFWVNIPYTPPPDPEADEPPKFEEVLAFREEYGLDLDLKGNEKAIAERVLNLIGDWYNPNTPNGEVARATWARWGVPLRAVDAAELEYRERYLAHNGPIIAKWGEGSLPGSYAGYYMDHRAGGKLRIGFTENTASNLEELPSELIATDRITGFAPEPNWSLVQLRAFSADFRERAVEKSSIMEVMASSQVDVRGNQMLLRATDTKQVEDFVGQEFPTLPMTAMLVTDKPSFRSNEENPRERELNHRLYAGDYIDPGCTLAFGAWERRGTKANGQGLFENYALGAGHCFSLGSKLRRIGWREDQFGGIEEGVFSSVLGKVTRISNGNLHAGFETDAAAVHLRYTVEVPRWIYWSAGSQQMINGEGSYRPGATLCYSGTSAGSHCAVASDQPIEAYYQGAAAPTWQIEVNVYGEGGDSGGPVWDLSTGQAVGLVTGGPPDKTWVTPLLPLNASQIPTGGAPGALNAPGMSPKLNVVDCCR